MTAIPFPKFVTGLERDYVPNLLTRGKTEERFLGLFLRKKHGKRGFFLPLDIILSG